MQIALSLRFFMISLLSFMVRALFWGRGGMEVEWLWPPWLPPWSPWPLWSPRTPWSPWSPWLWCSWCWWVSAALNGKVLTSDRWSLRPSAAWLAIRRYKRDMEEEEGILIKTMQTGPAGYRALTSLLTADGSVDDSHPPASLYSDPGHLVVSSARFYCHYHLPIMEQSNKISTQRRISKTCDPNDASLIQSSVSPNRASSNKLGEREIFISSYFLSR